MTERSSILDSQILAREAAGYTDLARAIVAREVALDNFLAKGDHDTPDAQAMLEQYRQRQAGVSALKAELGIGDPEPLPVETDKK